MALKTKLKGKLKHLDGEPIKGSIRTEHDFLLFFYILSIIKLREFMGGGLCWQEIRHHSATRHTAQPFFSLQQQQQSLRHPMTFLPKLGIILFLNGDHSNLAASFFAVFVKRFPHSPLSM